MKRKNYKLKLSDGITWGFTAVDRLQSWLGSFAEIMNLNQCSYNDNIDIRIIFIAFNAEEKPPCDRYDWKMFKSGRVFRVWHNNISTEIFIEICINSIDNKDIRIINMWNALKPIYRFYTKAGGGPMHAAFASLKGNGFLIAAPGNTGKSTSILRLPEYYEKISDDTVLVINKNDKYRAHPIPTWSDHLCNRKDSNFDVEKSFPLKAIFFLKQADRDGIFSIDKGKSALEIFEAYKQSWNLYWSRMDENTRKQRRVQTFNNAVDLAKLIPCYYLNATLTGCFWEEIEKVIGS